MGEGILTNEEPLIKSPEVIEFEEELLKTTWVEEAKQILKYVPEENLTKKDNNLLNKCIEGKKFTENQLKDFKKLLNKYRETLQTIRPEEVEQSVEEAVQLIKNEQEFLDLLMEDTSETLIVHMPLPSGKIVAFEFEVLPLKDSRIIEALELHIDIFRDFDYDEAVTYSNAINKNENEMTSEEKQIITKLNRLINNKLSTQKIESVNNFLANQLRIKGSTSDYKTRLQFWNKFHFNAKFSVFTVILNRLGLNEISDEKLFPFGE